MKNAYQWEKSAVETYKTLKKLNKLDDLVNFLLRLQEVFTE